MKFLYSLSGGNIPVIREFDIEANKQFRKGQVVRVSSDGEISTIAAGGCVGIAAEDHTGVKDILNERNNGTKLRIDVTKNAVYEIKTTKLTATGGSNTTFLCSSGDVSINLRKSRLVLVQKGDNSQNTDSAGTIRKVTNVTVSGTTATFTVSDGGIISEGDVYAVIPEYGYRGYAGDVFGFVNKDGTADGYVINSNIEKLTLEVLIEKDFIA